MPNEQNAADTENKHGEVLNGKRPRGDERLIGDVVRGGPPADRGSPKGNQARRGPRGDLKDLIEQLSVAVPFAENRDAQTAGGVGRSARGPRGRIG